MSLKNTVVIPTITAFGVTLATGIASNITDGRILNWTGVLTKSVPLTSSEFEEVINLRDSDKPYTCKEGRTVVGCFVGLYPSGSHFCGSQIQSMSNGYTSCKVNACGNAEVLGAKSWGITLTCASYRTGENK